MVLLQLIAPAIFCSLSWFANRVALCFFLPWLVDVSWSLLLSARTHTPPTQWTLHMNFTHFTAQQQHAKVWYTRECKGLVTPQTRQFCETQNRWMQFRTSGPMVVVSFFEERASGPRNPPARSDVKISNMYIATIVRSTHYYIGVTCNNNNDTTSEE
jgi:hypothetical protein